MFQQATFYKSAASWSDLPPEGGKEIAFIGRSNCGKSSTLNKLCSQRSLARTSRTPGRTQLINFFQLQDNQWLVDLPGYGFARASASARDSWNALIARYINTRHSLHGIILIMDIRHPLMKLDQDVLRELIPLNIPVHILLNKADKLGYGAQQQTFLKVKAELEKISPNFGLQTFSAHTGLNLNKLEEAISTLLNIASPLAGEAGSRNARDG